MSSTTINRTRFRLYTALGFSAVSLSIGAAPFLASEFFGELYGLAVNSPSATGYQQALGVRDAALGIAYLLSYFRRNAQAVEILLVSQGFLGLGDAMVVWVNGGDLTCLPAHLSAGVLAIGIGLGFWWYGSEEGVHSKDKVS